MAVIDLPGAFLNAVIKRGVIMKKEDKIAKLLVKMEPRIYGSTLLTINEKIKVQRVQVYIFLSTIFNYIKRKSMK